MICAVLYNNVVVNVVVCDSIDFVERIYPGFDVIDCTMMPQYGVGMIYRDGEIVPVDWLIEEESNNNA